MPSMAMMFVPDFNSVSFVCIGLWASPFFGAFSALRFLSLALMGQVILAICNVYTDDGLAFPGWIVRVSCIAILAAG